MSFNALGTPESELKSLFYNHQASRMHVTYLQKETILSKVKVLDNEYGLKAVGEVYKKGFNLELFGIAFKVKNKWQLEIFSNVLRQPYEIQQKFTKRKHFIFLNIQNEIQKKSYEKVMTVMAGNNGDYFRKVTFSVLNEYPKVFWDIVFDLKNDAQISEFSELMIKDGRRSYFSEMKPALDQLGYLDNRDIEVPGHISSYEYKVDEVIQRYMPDFKIKEISDEFPQYLKEIEYNTSRDFIIELGKKVDSDLKLEAFRHGMSISQNPDFLASVLEVENKFQLEAIKQINHFNYKNVTSFDFNIMKIQNEFQYKLYFTLLDIWSFDGNSIFRESTYGNISNYPKVFWEELFSVQSDDDLQDFIGKSDQFNKTVGRELQTVFNIEKRVADHNLESSSPLRKKAVERIIEASKEESFLNNQVFRFSEDISRDYKVKHFFEYFTLVTENITNDFQLKAFDLLLENIRDDAFIYDDHIQDSMKLILKVNNPHNLKFIEDMIVNGKRSSHIHLNSDLLFMRVQTKYQKDAFNSFLDFFLKTHLATTVGDVHDVHHFSYITPEQLNRYPQSVYDTIFSIHTKEELIRFQEALNKSGKSNLSLVRNLISQGLLSYKDILKLKGRKSSCIDIWKRMMN